MRGKRVGVFVYGDIGRSPRMQNHAIQLSKHFQEVVFMGYLQTKPRSEILDNPKIKIIDLQAKWLNKVRAISYYLYVLVRIVFQIMQILYHLIFKVGTVQFILIQNPPCIPNLMAIWIASLVKRFAIIIDFHNYGYTILALNVKNRHIIKLASIYQHFFGKKSARSFCVSEQMSKDLRQNWGIQATPLYDRPLGKIRKQVDKVQFFKKYDLELPQEEDIICVSSTSWTKDQDFSILLDAVSACQKDLSAIKKRLRVYITGKGPQKQYYIKKIKELEKEWKSLSVSTVWLDADDYPILLSLCDFGVCLHYSSSGLDLPMKVLDMFEAQLPVLAVHYEALSQLVKQGYNGFVFKGQKQLAQKIMDIAKNPTILQKLKKNVQKERKHTWAVQWDQKFFKK